MDTYRQPCHLHCVVVLVRALRDAVEFLEIERRGESVFEGVNVRYWDDTGGVVELRSLVVLYGVDTKDMIATYQVEEECVAT